MIIKGGFDMNSKSALFLCVFNFILRLNYKFSFKMKMLS